MKGDVVVLNFPFSDLSQTVQAATGKVGTFEPDRVSVFPCRLWDSAGAGVVPRIPDELPDPLADEVISGAVR